MFAAFLVPAVLVSLARAEGCGDDVTCGEDEECCGAGCMPLGGTCCGSTSLPEGGHCCEGFGCNSTDECCGEGCMPQGNQCCGDGVSAEPDGTCCPGEYTVACNSSQACCGPGCMSLGHKCCGDYFVTPELTCCGEMVACNSDRECCGHGCMPVGAECCGETYCPTYLGLKCCGEGDLGCCPDGSASRLHAAFQAYAGSIPPTAVLPSATDDDDVPRVSAAAPIALALAALGSAIALAVACARLAVLSGFLQRWRSTGSLRQSLLC